MKKVLLKGENSEVTLKYVRESMYRFVLLIFPDLTQIIKSYVNPY